MDRSHGVENPFGKETVRAAYCTIEDMEEERKGIKIGKKAS
ncbi:MAG: hypothetical protein SPJ13_02820 [Bacteroidales bacterium]|nr:hypothetical protein [Bacteroidales bacterium]